MYIELIGAYRAFFIISIIYGRDAIQPLEAIAVI